MSKQLSLVDTKQPIGAPEPISSEKVAQQFAEDKEIMEREMAATKATINAAMAELEDMKAKMKREIWGAFNPGIPFDADKYEALVARNAAAEAKPAAIEISPPQTEA